MDLLNILPALESIASSINFGPLNDLLAKIHDIVDRILLVITPDAPVRDGGQALIGYADHLSTLKTRLANGKASLQDVYAGPAADTYYPSMDHTLQILGKMQDHLNNAATYHGKLAEHFLEASVQQGMLVAQGAIMAGDLGSLIFTGGLDAPISVPVAAGDAVAAGGSVAAMDVAMTAAETTAEVIGESAADMGEMALDLGEEGTDVLADGETLADDGGILSDGGEPTPGDTPLDSSANGGAGGSGGSPGDTPPTGSDPTGEGPGQWEQVNESMSERAQRYQTQITGKEPGWVYRVNGVKFDGFDGETLLDAKGPGYAKFFNDSVPKPWWRGSDALLDEADRQIAAADGWPIQWNVAEQSAYDGISTLLQNNGYDAIDVLFTPPLP